MANTINVDSVNVDSVRTQWAAWNGSYIKEETRQSKKLASLKQLAVDLAPTPELADKVKEVWQDVKENTPLGQVINVLCNQVFYENPDVQDKLADLSVPSLLSNTY